MDLTQGLAFGKKASRSFPDGLVSPSSLTNPVDCPVSTRSRIVLILRRPPTRSTRMLDATRALELQGRGVERRGTRQNDRGSPLSNSSRSISAAAGVIS